MGKEYILTLFTRSASWDEERCCIKVAVQWVSTIKVDQLSQVQKLEKQKDAYRKSLNVTMLQGAIIDEDGKHHITGRYQYQLVAKQKHAWVKTQDFCFDLSLKEKCKATPTGEYITDRYYVAHPKSRHSKV